MLEIEVKKEIFTEIKDMDNYAFNNHLKNKLRALEMALEEMNEKKLLQKKISIEKRISKIMKELQELQEFCKRAERDKSAMEKWVDILDDENRKLLKEMREHGSSH